MRQVVLKPAGTTGRLIGVGGLGTGLFWKLEGNDTLNRNESRQGELLDVKDFCKLHIVAHYVATLLAAGGNRGFEVLPIGRLGDDRPGEFVRAHMKKAGMDLRYVRTIHGRPTMLSVCFQYPDGSGGNITASNSAAASLSPSDFEFLDEAGDSCQKSTIAMALPEVPLDVRAIFLSKATARGCFRVGSFTRGEIKEASSKGMLAHLDLVSLNGAEASELTGCALDPSNPKPLQDGIEQFVSTQQKTLKVIVSGGPMAHLLSRMDVGLTAQPISLPCDRPLEQETLCLAASSPHWSPAFL